MSTLRVLDKDGNWVDIPTIVGPVGPVGPTGETGPGVSSGGSTGQILRKKSGDDFDTEWVTPTDMDLYYTKEEADDLINSKISTTFKYKGTKSSYAAIEAVTNPAVGDVWNDASTDHNYVWNGSTWDKLAGTVDMSNYYTMDEAEDMVDAKLAAVPINDLLHYKGHVNTTEDLPSLGQPNADTVAPTIGMYSLRRLETSSYVTSMNTYLKSQLSGYNYYIASGRNYNTACYLAVASNNKEFVKGVFPYQTSSSGTAAYSSGYLLVHIYADEANPVKVRNLSWSYNRTLMYEDGTTELLSTSASIDVTKSFWVYLGYSGNLEAGIYCNLNKALKLEMPPAVYYGTGSSQTPNYSDRKTYIQNTLGRNYAPGYDLLLCNGTGLITYYLGQSLALENDIYSVGSMRELYRCNEKPEWEKLSDFKEFQVTEMTEDDYLELSDKNVFDMYVLDRIVEVTETTNLLLNSITGDVDLVEANISEEEALAITNEIIGGVSDE